MNKQQPQNESEVLKSRIKAVWNRLTDEEAGYYGTNEKQFFDTLEERYGIRKEEAEKKIREMKVSKHAA